jgi:uroporphyrinogen-III synthase
MPRSTAHLHVLNTRPADRAEPLTLALRQVGYTVSTLPLLAFERCVPEWSSPELLALHQLAQVVIVVSPMAAECGLTHWACAGVAVGTLPTQWVAVGAATAALLQAAGLDPICPTEQNSEGLLALPSVRQCRSGDTVVVWRGQGGRPLIQQTLLDKGVSLQSILWYKRVYPPQAVQQWQTLRMQAEVPHVVLISSGEAWQNWQQLAGVDAYVPWLLVLGERLHAMIAHQTSRISQVPSLNPAVIQQALWHLQQAQQL